MPANDDDVARYTSDGIVLTATRKQVLLRDSNAIDGGSPERLTFFDDEAGGQAMLEEAFGFLSAMGRVHEAVELGDSLGFGSVVPLWPAAPTCRVVDDLRGIDTTCIVRAYSFDMSSDSYAVELVGGVFGTNGGGPPVTFDSTVVTVDTTDYTMDAS